MAKKKRAKKAKAEEAEQQTWPEMVAATAAGENALPAEDPNDLPPPPEPHTGPAPNGIADSVGSVGGFIAPAAEAKPAPAAPKVSDAPLSMVEELEEVERNIALCEAELAEHQAKVKERQSALKAWHQRMRSIVRRNRDGETRELFPATQQAQAATEPAAGPDDWKAAPIADLNLKPSHHKALTEAGIETVGSLADFTAEGKPLNKLKGIGPAAVEAISDAAVNFHARRAATVSSTKLSSENNSVSASAGA